MAFTSYMAIGPIPFTATMIVFTIAFAHIVNMWDKYVRYIEEEN